MDSVDVFQAIVIAVTAGIAVEAVKPSCPIRSRIIFGTAFLVLAALAIWTKELAEAWPAASAVMIWVGSSPLALLAVFLGWVAYVQKPWRRAVVEAPVVSLESSSGENRSAVSATMGRLDALEARLARLERQFPKPPTEEDKKRAAARNDLLLALAQQRLSDLLTAKVQQAIKRFKTSLELLESYKSNPSQCFDRYFFDGLEGYESLLPVQAIRTRVTEMQKRIRGDAKYLLINDGELFPDGESKREWHFYVERLKIYIHALERVKIERPNEVTLIKAAVETGVDVIRR